MSTAWSRGAGTATVLALAAAAYAGSTQIRDKFGDPANMAFPGTNSQIQAFLDGTTVQTLSTFAFDLEMNDGAGWLPLITYCTEADQGIAFGPNPPDDVGAPFTVTDFSADARYSALDVDQVEIFWANAFSASLTDAVTAAAFQALMWELPIDSELNLGTGLFRLDTTDSFTADVKNLADQWIANVENGRWTTQLPMLLLTNPNGQDFMRPVPEPASAGLLALGALLCIRRRGR